MDAADQTAADSARAEVSALRTDVDAVASLDRIVVLDGGKVAEDGPHAQLIEQGGEYANLWSRQTGAYLEEE